MMPKSQADIALPKDKLTALAQAIAMATGVDKTAFKAILARHLFKKTLSRPYREQSSQ